MSEYLLEMQDICKSFSGVSVLDSVKFNLKPGEVHVLLGENGAGKSTLVKILSGVYTLTSGNILIEGKPVHIQGPRDGFKYGVSVIYQEFNLISNMSISENIFLGKEICKRKNWINWNETIKKSQSILNMLGLNINPLTKIKDLSIAQKQLIEIAKAIAMDVKILIFDEPTATLTDKETEYLFKIIRQLKSRGIGIVYISHRMKEIKEIGDRITVLRDGKYVNTVELEGVTENDLVKMMLGREISYEKKSYKNKSDSIVLEVKDISYGCILKNISFKLKKGTILGVAGLVGAGRTEMAKCIIGALPLKSGKIFLNGALCKIKSPSDAIKKGIAYLSEDRKLEGLVLNHSVKENILLPGLQKTKKYGFLNSHIQKNFTHNLIERFNIKVNDMGMMVRNLSGGNQQKVVIAKWIFKDADIYIIDEPTRGIDIGARQQIYDIMEQLLKKGASIVMISSDISEILKMSDQIMIMCEGKVSAILDNDEKLSDETILQYEIGGKEYGNSAC